MHLKKCVFVLQIFPYHYHPDFTARPVKGHPSSKAASSASHVDISTEGAEERMRYGGLSPHQHQERFSGTFPGNYSWLCRLDNLTNVVRNFRPENGDYLNFCRSSQLPDISDTASPSSIEDVQSVTHTTRKAWYEEPLSSVSINGPVAFSTQFVTSIQQPITEPPKSQVNVEESLSPSKRYKHWFLEAATQDDVEVIRIDLVSDLVVVYYGQRNERNGENVNGNSEFQRPASGMATYSKDSRTYSYAR